MGKIIVQQFLTLDGVMQAPGDPNEYELGGWQRPYISEEQLAAITKQAHEADALLLGRKTFEGFAEAWPSAPSMNGLAERMNAMPKLVVSRTLKRAQWNASLIDGDTATEIGRLKEQSGRHLLVLGSGMLIQTLIRHDLIDEYRLWMFPLVLGRGERLFREGGRRAALRLVDSEPIGSGAVILTYRPENRPE